MPIGSYNPNQRYQDRAAQRIAGILKIMAFVIVSIIIGFWLGKQFAAEQLIILKEANQTFETERKDYQKQITDLTASAQTANMRYEQLQEEVESILPEGPMQDIVTLVREQLTKGTDPERLSFVIRSARPPTGCLDPQSKRFVVATPANAGAKSVVQIADTVKITGDGISSVNEDGNPEAWYDQTKEVSITFTNGEETETKKGILPIRHSMVVEDKEYRFTIETGARSFAKVVFDSCDYP
jgi:FtsZ-binding cell division protein ZapB